MKKNILVSSLVLGLSLSSVVPTFAAEKSNTDGSTQLLKNVESGFIDLSNVENVSGVLTFEEVVNEIAAANNISVEQAAEHVISNTVVSETGPRAMSANATAYAATYRTLSTTLGVTDAYKPSLKYYCQTNESSGSFRSIVKVLNVQIDRSYNGMSKTFTGDIYTNLENGSTIYYSLSGDFWNNGTSTGGMAVNLGLGDVATVNFSGSYTTDHYEYHFQEGRRTF